MSKWKYLIKRARQDGLWLSKIELEGTGGMIEPDGNVNIPAALDILGSWGWELVSVNGETYIFKRPIE